MKNHELLNLIGEVNEDYVMEAGNNVVKPRFRWKTLAACAACAALIAAAYPVYQASHPTLHDYTVMDGGALTTLGDVKAPAGGQGESIPGGAYVGESGGTGLSGAHYSEPGQDAPAQEAAMEQYDKLLAGMGMSGEGKMRDYPVWFAGSWIEGENLVVAIVEDSRTPELEAKIREWTEGDIIFRDAKYSYSFLDGLMNPVTETLDGTGITCGIGVDVKANCLGVDLYGDGEPVPDGILAELAKLDPDGDAIRVRVFTQAMSTLTDEVKKGPEPVPGGATKPAPADEPTPAPVEDSERAVPAGEPGGAGELPQQKYDAPADADGQPCYDLLGGEDGLPGNGLLY